MAFAIFTRAFVRVALLSDSIEAGVTTSAVLIVVVNTISSHVWQTILAEANIVHANAVFQVLPHLTRFDLFTNWVTLAKTAV